MTGQLWAQVNPSQGSSWTRSEASKASLGQASPAQETAASVTTAQATAAHQHDPGEEAGRPARTGEMSQTAMGRQPTRSMHEFAWADDRHGRRELKSTRPEVPSPQAARGEHHAQYLHHG